MDYKTLKHDLNQYKKQYQKIINKIENYTEKIDYLNEQANELENLIFQYEWELKQL